MRVPKDGKVPDPKDTWSIVDGSIRCVGKPNGYIATEKEYGDYTLRVKWRFPADSKGGNSGVLLHVQEKDNVWPTSVEAQLFAGRAGDIWLIYPPAVMLEDRHEASGPEAGSATTFAWSRTTWRRSSASGTSTRSPAKAETSRCRERQESQ